MRGRSSQGLRGAVCFLGVAGAFGCSEPVSADTVQEGRYFKVVASTPVWYGSGSKFTVKALAPGTYLCGNALFGDPHHGVSKSCKGTAFLDVLACYPSQLGGTGSRAAWGVSLSPVQAWAGWWCGSRVQLVACVAESCKPDVAKGVIASVSDILNTQVKAFRTEEVDSDRLKAVWWPHAAEVDAMKGTK
jgi:hypothetical protein